MFYVSLNKETLEMSIQIKWFVANKNINQKDSLMFWTKHQVNRTHLQHKTFWIAIILCHVYSIGAEGIGVDCLKLHTKRHRTN